MINEVPLLKKSPRTGLFSSRQAGRLYSGGVAGLTVAVYLSVMCRVV